MIKEYIDGSKVHTTYIVMVKIDLELPMYGAFNVIKELKNSRKHLTPEKMEIIKDAFQNYGLIKIGRTKIGGAKCIST